MGNPTRLLTSALALAFLALAVPALGQSTTSASSAPPAGCNESNPCLWLVDVGPDGFSSSSHDLNATQGDWYVISIFNGDDGAHLVSLSTYAVSLKVNSDEILQSSAIHLTQAGTFTLQDSTGAKLKLTVVPGSVIDAAAASQALNAGSATSKTSGSMGAPSLDLVAAVAAVGILALARSRR